MIHNLPSVCVFPDLVFKEKMCLLTIGNPMKIFEYISAILKIFKYYLLLLIYVYVYIDFHNDYIHQKMYFLVINYF